MQFLKMMLKRVKEKKVYQLAWSPDLRDSNRKVVLRTTVATATLGRAADQAGWPAQERLARGWAKKQLGSQTPVVRLL